MMKIYENEFAETQQHPECRDGYVFAGNFTNEEIDTIGWKDKYVGVQA